MAFDLTTVATGMTALGIGIGAGIKMISPLFKGSNGNSYVPRTECKIIHAGQAERDERIFGELVEIKDELKEIRKHNHG